MGTFFVQNISDIMTRVLLLIKGHREDCATHTTTLSYSIDFREFISSFKFFEQFVKVQVVIEWNLVDVLK